MENLFSSVKVHFIPRAENQQSNSLAKTASTSAPPTTFKLKYHIEVRHRPSIPNNMQHWQVFDDDEKIRNFLEMVEDFTETHIDQENQNDHTWIIQEGEEPQEFQEKIANHRILVLKSNQIPKGLIPLERLFDQNEMPLRSTFQPQPEEVEDYDVGTDKEPRIVKLSNYLPPEIKIKYTNLLRRYKDVFAWSYDELRTYDTSVIEHNIPLKLGVKPFR
jgi:hypothetical protein